MSQRKQLDMAQRAYDAQEPPSDHDCYEDGHIWRKTRVAVIFGETVTEYKCRICGETKAE
jgi:hypothetical protein